MTSDKPVGELTLPPWSLRLVLQDALAAADQDEDALPMLNGVHLHTVDRGGNTVLVGSGTDRYFAVQASADTQGWFPNTFLTVPSVHLLITALTGDTSGDRDTDNMVRLVHTPNTVTLHQPTGTAITVPVGRSEFPLDVLEKVITRPPAAPVPQPSALAPYYLQVLVDAANRRSDRLRMTVPGGWSLAHFEIGDHFRAWLMPVREDNLASPDPDSNAVVT
jgi:hypothetical protein